MRNDETSRSVVPHGAIVLLALLVGLFLAAAPLSACEFTYTISGPGLSAVRVIPGVAVTLSRGAEYTLSVSYREDHGNCVVPAANTLFLVEEERWKAGKDYLPLELLAAQPWTDAGRSHSTTITFRASDAGTWPVQVIRECTRTGYNQKLLFRVT